MSNEVTHVDKRGESYVVTGYAKGRKASFRVSAEAVEKRFTTDKEAKAFFERSLPLGVEERR